MTCATMAPPDEQPPAALTSTPSSPPASSARVHVELFQQERAADRAIAARFIEGQRLKQMSKWKSAPKRETPSLFTDAGTRKSIDAQIRKGKQTALIVETWTRLVPPSIAELTKLDSFERGTLRVMLPSSAHLYEFKQLLLAGLEAQLISACARAGLRKIHLCRGGFSEEGSVDP